MKLEMKILNVDNTLTSPFTEIRTGLISWFIGYKTVIHLRDREYEDSKKVNIPVRDMNQIMLHLNNYKTIRTAAKIADMIKGIK